MTKQFFVKAYHSIISQFKVSSSHIINPIFLLPVHWFKKLPFWTCGKNPRNCSTYLKPCLVLHVAHQVTEWFDHPAPQKMTKKLKSSGQVLKVNFYCENGWWNYNLLFQVLDDSQFLIESQKSKLMFLARDLIWGSRQISTPMTSFPVRSETGNESGQSTLFILGRSGVRAKSIKEMILVTSKPDLHPPICMGVQRDDPLPLNQCDSKVETALQFLHQLMPVATCHKCIYANPVNLGGFVC